MIALRELERKDMVLVNSWRHEKELMDLLVGPYRYVGLESEEQWFDQYLKNRNSQVRLGIREEKTDALIGVVYLTQIDWLQRSAEFSIMIGNRAFRGRGIGYLASCRMLDYAFGQLNMHRIYLHVLESNQQAINLYQKIGFRQEGLLRDASYKNDRFHNVWIMSIFRKELHPKEENGE